MVKSYIIRMLGDMLPALPVILALRLLPALRGRRLGQKLNLWHEAGACLLLLWVWGILVQTISFGHILSHGFALGGGGLNLVPFREIAGMLGRAGVHLGVTIINILGNIAIFMPVGLLLPVCWRGFRRWWVTGLAGLCLSLFIEIMQLFCYRSTDVDDLILNTLGALAGYGLYRLAAGLAPGAVQRFLQAPKGGE